MGSISIVRASAGSGKTYLLAVEYIAVAMRYDNAFRSILAVTFTNKATAEMKRRILTELSSLAKGKRGGFFESIAERTGYDAPQIQRRAADTLSSILRDYSSFSVSTIDKFFQRIVRSFFRELGLDLHYQIEIDSSETLSEAIDLLIEKSYTDEKLTRKINRIVNEEIEAGRRVNPHGALEKLAKVILSEQYKPAVADDSIVESAFDQLNKHFNTVRTTLRKKAIGVCQMMEREGLSVDDFKSKSRGFATYFARVASSGSSFPPYSPTFDKTAQSTDEDDFAGKATIDKIRPILPQLMADTAQIKKLYDEFSALSPIISSFSRYSLLRNLSETFEALLASRASLSLSSTTDLIAEIVDGSDVPFIFERLGNRYSTIFIDEFQDTSPSQWQGFLPLLHEAISKSEERCVMLIGDIKQAIYRFRGGDWRLLGGVADREFEGSIEGSKNLTTSWRSDRQIVEFNNFVMRKVVDEAMTQIDSFLSDAPPTIQVDHLRTIIKDAYHDMNQILPEGKADGGYVEAFSGVEDETLEWMVEKVQQIATRYPLSKAAVLVRSKKEGAIVAQALIKSGIKIISDEILTVGSSATASFIVDLFRYAGETNAITLASINRYLDRNFTEPLTESEAELLMSIRSMSSIEAFETIIRCFDLQQRDPFYLQALYNLIHAFQKENSLDITEFAAAWDRSLSKSTIALPEIEDAIRILTIHKAKGLEYDAVVVPFTLWEIFPTSRPPTTIWCNTEIEPYCAFNPLPLTYVKELARSVYADHYFEQGVSSVVDNINLLYVALTRAKSELYLGVNEEIKKTTIGLLLSAAIADYLHSKPSIGSVAAPTAATAATAATTASTNTNQSPSDTIIFDKIESYPAPQLSQIEDPEQLIQSGS